MEHEDAERKIWLDYLGKLNDRDLQRKASGATEWALIGVAAIILYRCIPQAPAFLATRGAVYISLIILTLMIDLCANVYAALLSLATYLEVDIQPRLLPDERKRLFDVLMWVTLCVVFVIVVMHFASLHFLMLTRGRPRITVFVGVLLWIFVLVWVGEYEYERKRQSKEALHRKEYGTSLPVFDYGRIPSEGSTLKFIVWKLFLAGLALFGFFMYLAILASTRIDWVRPLGAATQCLALVVVLAVLFLRYLLNHLTAVFRALERDVALGELPISDIKSRFVKIIGTPVKEWLQTVEHTRNSKIKRFSEVLGSLSGAVEEVQSINEDYQIERVVARATKLREEFKRNRTSFLKELEGVHAQVTEFSGRVAGNDDLGLFRQVAENQIAQWKTQEAQLVAAADQLDERLRVWLRAQELTQAADEDLARARQTAKEQLDIIKDWLLGAKALLGRLGPWLLFGFPREGLKPTDKVKFWTYRFVFWWFELIAWIMALPALILAWIQHVRAPAPHDPVLLVALAVAFFTFHILGLRSRLAAIRVGSQVPGPKPQRTIPS